MPELRRGKAYTAKQALGEKGMGKMNLKVGDKVTTDFYPKDKSLVRVVTKIERYEGSSESGWRDTTKDQYGRVLSCDMNWYNNAVELHS